MSIEVNATNAKRLLATDLARPIQIGTMGVAAAVQNVLAPYPRPRPRIAGKGYYIRGKGLFTAAGKLVKSSETLNRKWSIRKVEMGARLRNTASYAQDVHGKRKQRRYHGKQGWVREDTAIRDVQKSGQVEEIMNAAINAAFREAVK